MLLLRHRGDLLVKCTEGDIVSHPPVSRVLFFAVVIDFPREFLPPRSNQIAAHIREIDVTPIEIIGVIALLLQTGGDAR